MTQAHDPLTPVQRGTFLATVGVLFASVCFGLVPLFSRGLTEAGMPSFAVAWYRYVLASVFLLPSLYLQRRHWREVLWGIGTGVVMGLGWVGYVEALRTVPVSVVGVLYMTYPVFTVVIAWLLFGDRPSLRAVIAAVLIVLAALIAAGPSAVTADQLPALILSLAAPLGFGLGISVLVHRLSRVRPLARIASVSLGSMLGLSPLMLAADPATLIPQSGAGWALVVGIGLLTALIPQLIYTICTPIVGTSRAAVIGAIELPTMFAVGLLAYGERITLAQALAGGLVLFAITLTRSRKARNVSATATRPRRP